MPSRVFHIYKQLPTGGTDEEFSNAYRYTADAGVFDVPNDVVISIVQRLRLLEQACHANTVQFTRATSAPITSLNNVGPIDYEEEFENRFGDLVPPAGVTVGAPENIIMVQERVGPKNWIRKFLHTCAIGFTVGPDQISFTYDTTQTGWANVESYADGIGVISNVGSGETPEYTAEYETPSNLVSGGDMLVDDRIRWHDLNY